MPIPTQFRHIDDDGKLQQRFCNKRVNAKKEGLKLELTLEQFCQLVEDAGVKSSALGIKGYHLARHNDQGDYTFGNCSFVPYLDNLNARKPSEKAKTSSKENIKKALAASKTVEATAARNAALAEYQKLRKDKAIEREQLRKATLNPNQSGDKNSQAGSFWITDGTINKKCRGVIPDGFIKGRITK